MITNISFDLATALKNMGYPQTGFLFYDANKTLLGAYQTVAGKIAIGVPVQGAPIEGGVTAPTTNELITELGIGLASISRNSNNSTWRVYYAPTDLWVTGDSADEALANLFLKLHTPQEAPVAATPAPEAVADTLNPPAPAEAAPAPTA